MRNLYVLRVHDGYTKFWATDISTVKVQQSHYKLGQALRVPGGWGSQISRPSVHEGGEVVSPTHRPPLSPRKNSWYSFLLEAKSTPGALVRPEGLNQWKIPMTPSEIEPATFRLVAQCLNQLRHITTVLTAKYHSRWSFRALWRITWRVMPDVTSTSVDQMFRCTRWCKVKDGQEHKPRQYKTD